jgi:very-short-patch-repair endonuclease
VLLAGLVTGDMLGSDTPTRDAIDLCSPVEHVGCPAMGELRSWHPVLPLQGEGECGVAWSASMANERARELRKGMSDAERKLWRVLRGKQIDGVRFRRQHPLGRYIVDFVCLERRLVIEVDGGQHTEDDHVASDTARDRWLAAEGYRVMRVTTVDVHTNLEGVGDTIWAAVQECC